MAGDVGVQLKDLKSNDIDEEPGDYFPVRFDIDTDDGNNFASR